MPSPWCFNSLCTGMARDGVKVPLHGNRTNLHGHLPGVHGHVCTVAGKFSGTVMRVAQPLPSRLIINGNTKVTAPVKPQERKVAWQGLGNTHDRRTNTANRAPNMPTHHRNVSIPVDMVSIEWNIHNNPYHPAELQVETPR